MYDERLEKCLVSLSMSSLLWLAICFASHQPGIAVMSTAKYLCVCSYFTGCGQRAAPWVALFRVFTLQREGRDGWKVEARHFYIVVKRPEVVPRASRILFDSCAPCFVTPNSMCRVRKRYPPLFCESTEYCMKVTKAGAAVRLYFMVHARKSCSVSIPNSNLFLKCCFLLPSSPTSRPLPIYCAPFAPYRSLVESAASYVVIDRLARTTPLSLSPSMMMLGKTKGLAALLAITGALLASTVTPAGASRCFFLSLDPTISCPCIFSCL